MQLRLFCVMAQQWRRLMAVGDPDVSKQNGRSRNVFSNVKRRKRKFCAARNCENYMETRYAISFFLFRQSTIQKWDLNLRIDYLICKGFKMFNLNWFVLYTLRKVNS